LMLGRRSITAVCQARPMLFAGDLRMDVMEVMMLHRRVVNKLARRGVTRFAA
jgi:hypothetical protein